ncbi:hypothetical protein ACEK07_21255 [Alcanivoracaceae bacterium MT1]
MTRQEWTNRCAQQLWKRDSSRSWQSVLRRAGTLADVQSDLNGASGLAWQSPEDAADEHDPHFLPDPFEADEEVS